jgi:stringent starvation protein B
MTSNDRPTKQQAFMAFLSEGWVSIHLDARRAGVSVPAGLTISPHLVLQYGRDMPIPIPDLEVTDEGVFATLSFQRTPHRTFVPWEAVYIVACTDGRGILYYEDVPEEVSLVTRPAHGEAGEAVVGAVAEGEDVGGSVASDGGAPDIAPARTERILKAVPLPEAPTDEPDEDDVAVPASATTSRRRKKPQLRIVK